MFTASLLSNRVHQSIIIAGLVTGGQVNVLKKQGELSEAGKLLTNVLNTSRQVLGDNHQDTVCYMRSLGQVQMEQERFADAESLLREAVGMAGKILPEESLERISYHKDYGRCLLFMERFVDAEEHLIKAFEGYRGALDNEHAFTQDSIELLIELYDAWGMPEKAAEYRALLAGETEPLSEDDSE